MPKMELFEVQADADLLIEAAKNLERHLTKSDWQAALGRVSIIRIYSEGIHKFLIEQMTQD